ncbi:MAG: DUF4445 domain-containing protein [Actinobacteria bacterium]|nr:DUF4445 domain-containing protein [Actinomycetota bacterium]
MEEFEVQFLPQGKTVRVRKGMSVLDAAREAFIDIETSCNGKGTCGKCRIRYVEGTAGAPHRDELIHIGKEDLDAGVRLACRTTVSDRASVNVIDEPKKKHRILSEGFMPSFTLDPNIRKVYVDLPKPSLEDNVDDIGRLERALGLRIADSMPISLLRELPGILRENDFKLTIVHSGGDIIAIEAGDTSARCYGVAVDIGTTTVVASLVDLDSGDERASASMINPQKNYGLDVLTRIGHIRAHPGALHVLSGLIRQGINALIGEVCETAGVDRQYIYEAAVAANSTMMHLFIGVDATALGSSPYVSVFTSARSLPAAKLGLEISECGTVYCLPAVSSYIGADITAGLIVAELDRQEQKALFIDIGTNGEIVFGSKDGLYACSCAAGPALEGMNITCGMRAAEGAVEKVFIDDVVSIHTIGDKPATGICGSGIIDVVAELIKAGAIAPSGRLAKFADGEAPLACHAHLRNGNKGVRFVLSDACETRSEVAITQKDIRQVQLAKGAILSGIVSLTSQLNIGVADIERVYVAGAFGRHVRLESLARLGVFPDECLDRVTLVGNSAKTGAMLCLLSKEKREEATRVARRVHYIELSCYPRYDRLFAECLAFPKTKGEIR